MAQSSPLSGDIIAQLAQYSACDISDALLKLKVAGAGYIADLVAYSPQQGGQATESQVTIAPVFTILFAPKERSSDDGLPSKNIPKDSHWADIIQPGTFAVLKQPPGQTNAVCGGIMALRMKIWAYGTSTVGSGGGSVPWATQVAVEVNGVQINPGDVAFSDPGNGVVIIPRDKVGQVLELLPSLVAADAKVKEDVLKGMSVYEAFKLHRGA
ncbi:hypothetical protein ACHAPE_008508 [Trichoderma viride]